MPARDTLNPKALAFFLSVSGFISTVKAGLNLGSFFSFSLVIITVRKDRREYIEWEKSLYKNREN